MTFDQWLARAEVPAGQILSPDLLGFRFVAPAGWTVSQTPGLKSKVLVSSPDTLARIVVLCHKAPGYAHRTQEEIDAENAAKPVLAEDWQAQRLGKVVACGPVVLDGHPSALAVLDPPVKGMFGMFFPNRRSRLACLLASRPGQIWQVVGAAQGPTEAAAQAAFAQHAPALLGSLLTFRCWTH
jgi:hypothetical protein